MLIDVGLIFSKGSPLAFPCFGAGAQRAPWSA